MLGNDKGVQIQILLYHCILAEIIRSSLGHHLFSKQTTVLLTTTWVISSNQFTKTNIDHRPCTIITVIDNIHKRYINIMIIGLAVID
jgi:hypothetical protein